MEAYVFLIGGLFLLIKSADYLVKGGTSLAKRLKVSDLLIGLTVVALGTSAPELVINLVANWHGQSQLAISNVIGSNLVNLLFILGLVAMIHTAKLKHNLVWRELPISLAAVMILFFLASDIWLGRQAEASLSRADGFILLSFFGLYLYYIYIWAKASRASIGKHRLACHYKPLTAVAFLLLGFVGLAVGGELTTKAVQALSRTWGMSQAFIGLTVTAIGSSLPELATALVAAYHKNTDLAVGDVIGANIFNIVWALGLTAAIKPMSWPRANMSDLVILFFATTLLLLWLIRKPQSILNRRQGATLVFFYILYLISIFVRG